MTARELNEYSALRDTIRQRGSLRITLFLVTMIAWAAATIAGSNACRAMKTIAARKRPGAKLGSNDNVRSTARSRSSPQDATPNRKW